MELIADTLIPLRRAELNQVVELARKRNDTLRRGRAQFTCSTTEAGAAEEHPSFPPACVRMEYHWDGETIWQARAWDVEGNLISDTASDGEWVEAGGKRWHTDYLLDPYGGGSAKEEVEKRRSEASIELTSLLWCRSVCVNHLTMNNPLAEDFGVPVLRDMLFRDEITNEIVYRAAAFDQTLFCYRYTLWDRLRWWWTRRKNPDLTLDEFLGIPAPSLDMDIRVYLDPKSLQALRSEGWWKSPQLGDKPGSEHWLSPIATAGGSTVASRHESYAGLEDATLLRHAELVEEESEIGPDAATQIRPVDYTLPQVEW